MHTAHTDAQLTHAARVVGVAAFDKRLLWLLLLLLLLLSLPQLTVMLPLPCDLL